MIISVGLDNKELYEGCDIIEVEEIIREVWHG